MKPIPSIRNHVVWAVLGVFLLSAGTRMANYHLHRLPGGRVVVHAHPYQKDNNSPFQHHPHTAFELVWLDHVAKAVPLLAVALGVAWLLARATGALVLPHVLFRPSCTGCPQPALRGPPAFLSFPA